MKQMSKLVTQCPACQDKLLVTRLSCTSCDLQLEGQFEIPGLLSLDRVGGNKSAGAGKVRCVIEELKVDRETIAIDALLSELPDMDSGFYQDWRQEVSE